jgi:multidrug efflux pump subunit AcrA (membrane-fusion protein)
MQFAPEEPLSYAPSKVSWVVADFVSRPPAWMPRAFLYALAASLLFALTYASLAEVAIHVDARGVLQSDPPIMPIVAPVSFKVQKLLVREQQEVKKGDVLLVAEGQLPKGELERIRALPGAIDEFLSKHRHERCPDCRFQLARIANEAFFIRGLPELGVLLAPAREALEQLLTAFARYDQSSIGKTSGQDGRARDSGSQRGVRAEGESPLTSPLETVLDEARHQLDVKMALLIDALETRQSERDVVAPISGVVQHLRLSGAGQFIGAGSEIMNVIPANARFVAALAVSDKDISAVRVGLPVTIRLDAFPERQYGTSRGSVETVPLSTSPIDGGSRPAYAVNVRLDRQSVSQGAAEYPFRIGMQLEGWIVTGHVSMLDRAVDKLLGLSHGLGRDPR